MTEASTIQKPVHWFAERIDWFVYDRELRHEKVKNKNFEIYMKQQCYVTVLYTLRYLKHRRMERY